MTYVQANGNTANVYPYSITQLKRDNPNVSFPSNISAQIMASFGMYPVTSEDFPEYNPFTQKIVTSSTPTLNDNNAWVLTHTVEDLTEEEVTSSDERFASKNREKRNALLAETDYFALSDVEMSDSMQTYRQSLRDITLHENWPRLNADTDWPTKP
jgi:hypothetical protein